MLYLTGEFVEKTWPCKAQFPLPIFPAGKPRSPRWLPTVAFIIIYVIRLQINFISGSLVLPMIGMTSLPDSGIHIWKAQYPTVIHNLPQNQPYE